MENLLNKEFDRVVCINLAERKDKKTKMQERFHSLGISVDWFTSVQYGFVHRVVPLIVDAGVSHFNKQTPNEMGCAMSHYAVIKQALIDGVERLFVFEDDAKFHTNFNEKLSKYWDDLPSDWDMVSFYSFMYELLLQNTRVSKKWMRAYKSWSLMAYGMNRKFMEAYVQRQDTFFTISDMVTYKMQEEGYWNIYTSVPSLCVPESGLGSNIRGNNQNYKSTVTATNMGYPEANYE